MVEPFTTTAAMAAALDWSMGRLGDRGLRSLKGRMAERAAKQELAEIAAYCVEEAAQAAPGLASLLRSDAYINNVLAPGILDILLDPGTGISAEGLADRFIERFVAPYVARSDIDETLHRLFKTEPMTTRLAFERLVNALRRKLKASTHWRTEIAQIDAEETRLGVLAIGRKLDAILPETRDLEDLRADAKTGSDQLRTWPTKIRGLYLDRPELPKLIERVRTQPEGSTLVIGASGSGKSALLADLTGALEQVGMTVFAIKADKLSETVRSLKDVSRELGMSGDIEGEIAALAAHEPVVVIIDQLDAVSEVMDRGSERMNLLLRLVTRARRPVSKTEFPPIHVVVSSRPFEAHYDARFLSLDAERIELMLPDYARVEEFLNELGILSERVPAGLRETLRRPFMLKLFVDIALRNEPTEGLVEAELLTAWLASPQIGSSSERREVLELLGALADEMMETESLWRPADRYALAHSDALKRAEACELVVRRDGKIGFSHQAWLDDFQAKRFTTGEALAHHAWDGQDSLFGRATILRCLERFRALDESEYGRALDRLLGDPRTRRHLRHLAVEFLAGQPVPIAQEIRWVQRLILNDAVLARVAFVRLVDHWHGWRNSMLPYIPEIVRNENFKWHAVAMATAEAVINPNGGEELVQGVWGGVDNGLAAFEICQRATLWSSKIKARIQEIFERAPPSMPMVAHYISKLTDAGMGEAGVELLDLYLDVCGAKLELPADLHRLATLAELKPALFAKAAFPWFVERASQGIVQRNSLRPAFPYVDHLAFRWRDRANGHDDLLSCLHRSMELCAVTAPDVFREIVSPYLDIEIDEIQGMIAEAYAAGAAHLALEATDWLLADLRRLRIGAAHGEDEHNVSHLVHDWSTRVLLVAVVPVLDQASLLRIRNAIETWIPYINFKQLDARSRRDRLRWADDDRTALLALLPQEILAPRRRRQIAEALSTRPTIAVKEGFSMAHAVGAPMSDTQMARANDDDIFRIIDELHDSSGHSRMWRSGGFAGGVRQLSQAFGAFAKSDPRRAIALVRKRFKSGRHERCAGALIRDVAQLETSSDDELVSLIGDLDSRGFKSAEWRNDAAWALQNIAQRQHGLQENIIEMLGRWLENDPDVVSQRITARKNLEQSNREWNSVKAEPRLEGLLFGRGFARFGGPNGDNYPILNAIGCGLLFREPPNRNGWLEFLEQYIDEPEDPAIWAAILERHTWGLWNYDISRIKALFHAIWANYPETFAPENAHYFWRFGALIPGEVRVGFLNAWLADGETRNTQLAGEFVFAAQMLHPEDVQLAQLGDRILAGTPESGRIGALFAIAAAWRQRDDAIMRAAAHAILLPLAQTADGRIAEAISSALDFDTTLIPDEVTREMLQTAVQNPKLLKACLTSRFSDELQELLQHPTFEMPVLEIAEAVVDLLLAELPERMHTLHDQNFVTIAISLQRSGGDQRTRAMNLYERLLDAGNHFASQAAKESTIRG